VVKPQGLDGSKAIAGVSGKTDTPPLGENVSNKGDIEKLIIKYFGKDADMAIAIAKAESGMTSDAVHVNQNGSRDIGVFQINSCHGIDSEKLKNPDFNIRYAKELYDRNSWYPWSAFNNQSYLNYLYKG